MEGSSIGEIIHERKRKRCPRGCGGSLYLRENMYCCTHCPYTESLNFEHSEIILSQQMTQEITELELKENQKKYYVSPKRRRNKGIKTCLLSQIESIEKKFLLSMSIRDTCMDFYRILKKNDVQLPTWITVNIIYVSFFGVHPVFISDIVAWIECGLIPYQREWKKYYDKFIRDINKGGEIFDEVKNVSIDIDGIPSNVNEIWVIGVKSFWKHFDKVCRQFLIEPFLVELIGRILNSNERLLVILRKVIYDKCITLLKQNRYTNPFIDEFAEDRVVKIYPPEVSLISYIMTAFNSIYREDDEQFQFVIKTIKKNESFQNSSIQIDQNKFLHCPRNVGNARKYLSNLPMEIDSLSSSNVLNKNFDNTFVFSSESKDEEFLQKKFKIKKPHPSTLFLQNMKKESKNFLINSGNPNFKTLRNHLQHYDDLCIDTDDLMDQILSKRNTELIKLSDLKRKDSSWKYLFEILQFKTGLLRRDKCQYFKVIKLSPNVIFPKMERLFQYI